VLEPEHVKQVIHLGAVERNRLPFSQRGIEIDARGAEIVVRHAVRVKALARPRLRQTAGLWRGGADYAWIAVFPTHSAAWYIRPVARQPAIMHAGSGEGQFMNLRRAALISACMSAIAAAPAAAQAPWPQQQQQQPAASPWTQQQIPPCLQEFGKLRDETQKRAAAIQAAGKRKAPPQEACALFNAFSAAEVKLLKFATTNMASCGIPPQVPEQLKKGHVRTEDIRSKVCQAAAAPPRPAGPSLSDALSAPITDSNNIKTGGGTFDTLTGTPLGSK